MGWDIFFLGVLMLLPMIAGGLTFVLSAQETERLRHNNNK